MIQQRSPEWYEQRLGKVTASDVTNVRNKALAGYKNYLTKLLLERLTGEQEESYTNASMQWGVDYEETAALEYALARDVELADCEFVDHPTIRMSGASPDKEIVGANAGIETKCPNSATHIEYMMTRKIPTKYKDQMMWQMACKGWQYIDFVSYDPRMPVGSQLVIIRLERDDDYIKKLEQQVEEFQDALDERLKFVKEYKLDAVK